MQVWLVVGYNANGGNNAPPTASGPLTVSTLPVNVTYTLSNTVPWRNGYDFLGWSSSATATTASWQPGGKVSLHITVNGTNTFNFYAVWKPKEYVVFYRPGTYGSGTATSDTKIADVDLTLRGRLFTRSGYTQAGWSTSANGDTNSYALGGTYSANAGITLYPYWSILVSTISSVTSSVPADGTTQGTVTINRPVSSYTHKVEIILGERSQEFTNVATSQTFTIPASWVDQIPAATSAVATVRLTTYKGGSQIGRSTKTFTVTVPESVVPTVSVTATNVSDNSTVSGWDILLQGYSKIQLNATATAGTGSTIASTVYSGEGFSNQSVSLSDVITSAGSKTWTVTVTDARGRTASATLTRTVHEYYPASIIALTAYRSVSNGTAAPADGTYISAIGNYSFASCDGHNSASVRKIEYKTHTGTTWTTGRTTAVSGTRYTFGGGNISILTSYDVRLTVKDALNSTVQYVVNVSSVEGVSFGLNGKCARFGGPVTHPDRFECDWLAQFNDDIIAPKHIQSGVVASKATDPSTTRVESITFDTEFDVVPNIVTGLISPQTYGMELCSVSVWNINKAGFSLRITNGYEYNRKLGAFWVAVSPGSKLPRIMEQPASQTVTAGSSATFSVGVVEATSYQWYVLASGGSTWQAVSGATSDSYTFTATAAMNGDMYKCVASNQYGDVESDTAVLIVN